MSKIKRKKIIVILGPTAAGKTKFAVTLAKIFSGEIISADSRQVYQGLDLGTGKDLPLYQDIIYHLIDIITPEKQFTLADWQAKAYRAINQILRRHKLPILVGGTGLYLQAVLEGWKLPQVKPNALLRQALDKKNLKELQFLAKQNNLGLNQSDFANRRRLIRLLEITQIEKNINFIKQPKYDYLIFGLQTSRDKLKTKINRRLLARLKAGLIKEVKRLHAQGISWERLESFGLEYKWVARYLQRVITLDEMTAGLEHAIQQYAKRQMTWFRRMERQGIEIHWNKKPAAAAKMIREFIR